MVAVVVGTDGGAAARATEAQDVSPSDILESTSPADAAAVALERDAGWLWLVEAGVAPAPDALGFLLDAVPLLDPPPVLLASKLITPGGGPDPGSLPVVEVRDPDLAVAAYEHGLVALRVARRGSLLLGRDVLELVVQAKAAPDVVWTARILKRQRGVLVPRSVAVGEPSHTRRHDVAARARLVTSSALEARERPWFAFRLLEDLSRRAS